MARRVIYSTTQSAGVRHSYLDLAKTRRRGAVTGTHGLHGLSFAAVGSAPQHPLLGAAYGIAGVPEFCGHAAVTRVFEPARLLAVLNLPADFGAELKIVAAIVDRPAAIGLEIDAVLRISHEIV